jgi:hypothetical protein
MRTQDNIFAELDRSELEEYYGLKMVVDFGDDFFNALIYGTLKTLIERVDSSGFCQTSFGEQNNVRCYGQTHYPRDTAEAARVLANWGLVEYAIRILDFTLRNKPKDQYYLPHVYRPDGTIKANTIQIDTPAHVILALARCVEIVGPADHLYTMFYQLNDIVDGSWQHHYHSDWQLLDAGNYNEQIPGKGIICDLFTSCAFVSALEQMVKLAQRFHRTDLIDKYQSRLELLAAGIEKHLFDHKHEMYLLKKDFPDGEVSRAVNWVNLYVHRWYAGQPQGWDNIYEELKRDTSIDWDGINVISGSPMREGILGKHLGFLLAYLAKTGRFQLLSEHLQFTKQTIVKPSNVYPEWWYYQEPDPMEKYWIDFWQKYGTTWQSYRTNPQGDYTVDSGNCEQSAVFLHHCVKDLLGVHVEDGILHLSPRLPFEFEKYSAKNVPLFMSGEKLGCLGYELSQSIQQINCRLRVQGVESFGLTLAIPDGKDEVKVCVDGRSCEFKICQDHDVRWISVEFQKAKEKPCDHEIVVQL